MDSDLVGLCASCHGKRHGIERSNRLSEYDEMVLAEIHRLLKKTTKFLEIMKTDFLLTNTCFLNSVTLIALNDFKEEIKKITTSRCIML